MEVLKSDKQQVFGFASMSEIIDSQGDEISAETLEEAAYNFVINSRAGHEMHQGGQVAELIESFFISKEKADALGIDSEHIGKWFVGFKVNDADVWAKVKNGQYKAFSIGGRARRV